MKKIIDAINKFNSINALVVGDLMLDVYKFCLSSESKVLESEKPGKRAYRINKSIKALGGAGNVASNLSSLGVKTSLISITGNDENYFKIRELCDCESINHYIVRDFSRPTTIKTRIYLDNEYLLRLDDENDKKVDNETTGTLLSKMLHVLPKMDVVILSDYNKGIFTEYNSQRIIRECRANSIPIIVDFKPGNKELFSRSTILCPNETEAKAMLESFNFINLQESMEKLYKILKCDSLVVTLGENGICGINGNEYFYIAGNKVKALDSVGCGDTVRAALALGAASNLSLKDALILANDTAGVIVQKPATASLSKNELIDFISKKYAK
jgi:D-glycero-beta-D-manno-heptose-7-phosphate kinase